MNSPKRVVMTKVEANGKLVKSAPIIGWFYDMPEAGRSFYMEYGDDRCITTSTVQKVEELWALETDTLGLHKIHTLNSVYILEIED